jgi:hypothetical protein
LLAFALRLLPRLPARAGLIAPATQNLCGIFLVAVRFGKQGAFIAGSAPAQLHFKPGYFMTILDRNIPANSGKEIIERRKAYLYQVDVVARELCRLSSISDRTLGFLTDTEADARLLDAVQQKSNDILALQRQLRELWAPFLIEVASPDARVMVRLPTGQ